MIYFGDKKVKKCFLGGNPLSRVYLGDDLLYQHVSRLPTGYTEVQYISNPNLGYFANCGISAASSPFANKKIEMSLKINDPDNSAYSSGAYILGAYCSYRASSSSSATTISREHSLYYSKNNKTISNAGGGSVPISDIVGNVLNITWDYTNKTLMINDKSPVSITAPSGMSKSVAPALFARHIASYTANTLTSNSYANVLNCNLYSFKISQSDTVLNEWVPCINPDGLVGIYDIVNDVFQSSGDATKPFVAGPAA